MIKKNHIFYVFIILLILIGICPTSVAESDEDPEPEYVYHSRVSINVTTFVYRFENGEKVLIDTSSGNKSGNFIEITNDIKYSEEVNKLKDEIINEFGRESIVTYNLTQGEAEILFEAKDDFFKTHVYQQYNVTAVFEVINPQLIDKIYIENVTASFNANDEPIFSGNVPEKYKDIYTLVYEDWHNDNGQGKNSSSQFNKMFYTDLGKELFHFNVGDTYFYNLRFILGPEAANQNAKFADDIQLFINGQSIDLNELQYMNFDAESYEFYNVLSMSFPDIVTEEQSPSFFPQTGDNANLFLWGILLISTFFFWVKRVKKFLLFEKRRQKTFSAQFVPFFKFIPGTVALCFLPALPYFCKKKVKKCSLTLFCFYAR